MVFSGGAPHLGDMVNETNAEWSGARGEKWRMNINGMEAMLEAVDDPLIRALRLDAPCRVVDIGCGGGGTSLKIHRRAPPGSTVHGVDVSPALIEWARHQGRSSALTFEVADAATAVPEAPFDRLVSRFGVMFFEDPSSAFRNLRTYLKANGRFALAVWGPPDDNPWMTTVRDVVDGFVDLPPPTPGGPGPFRYAGGGELRLLLDRAGFEEVEVHDWIGDLPIGGGLSAREAAHFALVSFSNFGELLSAAGPSAVEQAQRALASRYLDAERAGQVWMKARVHIVSGVRPS